MTLKTHKKRETLYTKQRKNFEKVPISQNFVTTHSRKTHLTSFMSVCVFFIFVGFSVTFTMVSFFFLLVQNNHQDQFNKVQIAQLGQVLTDHFDTVNPLLSPQWWGGGGYLIQYRQWYQFFIKNQNTTWKSSSTRNWKSYS